MLLDVTTGILAGWVVKFYEAEPALARPLVDQPNLADNDVCNVSFTLLFGEAVERLVCARLLLYTGHQSRAIASCRDSLEALQWAHVARETPPQARRWLAGKKIVVPRGLATPPYVSDRLRNATSQLFNVLGTHAYRDAVFLSLSSSPEGQPAGVQHGLRGVVGAKVGRVLATTGLVVAYSLDQFPSTRTPDALRAVSAVENITGKLLGLRTNLRDPMLSGYEASF